MLDRVGLSSRLTHKPGELSGGERQRAAVARALVTRPVCVLADEPTGNLDRENTAIVIDTLADFAQAGGAVLMVTHSREAAARGDRVVHLQGGCLVDANGGDKVADA